MSISYDSIGQVCITCLSNGVQVNQPIKLISNNSVSPCVDGDAIEGVVAATHANLSTVAVKGFVTLTYVGATPTLGYCPLAAAGNGKVKKQDGARDYLVVDVETNKKTVTFCM